MEKGCGDGDAVELEISADACRAQGMVNEIFTAFAEAALMLSARVLESACYQVPVKIGIVFGNSLKKILQSGLFGP